MEISMARRIVERSRASGLLREDEYVVGDREFGTDQWNVEIWELDARFPLAVIREPEDWTSFATRRGAEVYV